MNEPSIDQIVKSATSYALTYAKETIAISNKLSAVNRKEFLISMVNMALDVLAKNAPLDVNVDEIFSIVSQLEALTPEDPAVERYACRALTLCYSITEVVGELTTSVVISKLTYTRYAEELRSSEAEVATARQEIFDNIVTAVGDGVIYAV